MENSLRFNASTALSLGSLGLNDVDLELHHSVSTNDQFYPLFFRENFSNATNILDEFRNSLTKVDSFAVIALITLYAMVFLVGLIGNFVIIYFVSKNRSPIQMRARNRMLINLCVADLLVIIVCCPMAAYTSGTKIWLMGQILCKLLSYLQGMAVTAGTLSLTMLSLYRYIFIRYPHIYRKLSETYILALVIMCVWMLAALISLPMIFARTLQELKLGPIHAVFCVELWQSDVSRRVFTLVTLLIVYVLPCGVLIVCHTCVSCTLCVTENSVLLSRNDCRQRSFRCKRVWLSGVPAAPPNSVVESLASDVFRSSCHHSSYHSDLGADCENTTKKSFSKQKHGLKSRKKLANLLMGMTLCFVICWLPYNVTSFYVDLYPTPSLVIFLPFTLLLGHSHSAINPLVYWLMNRNVTLKMKDVLCSKSGIARKFPMEKPDKSLSFAPCKESTFTSDSIFGAFHPKYALREFSTRR